MQIVRLNEVEREAVQSALFTDGAVSRQTPFRAPALTSLAFAVVSFGAGVRNKLHRHTSDQILIITEGSGVVATADEERPVTVGDIVLIPAGEDHWHGAPGATAMSHITIQAMGSQTTQLEA